MRAPMDRSKAKPTTLALIEELEFFANHTCYSLNEATEILGRTQSALLAVSQKYACTDAYETLSGRNTTIGKVPTGAIRL